MKLIILLLCVFIQIINASAPQNRYALFDRYLVNLGPLLTRFGLNRGWKAIIGILIPISILVWIFNIVLGQVALLYIIYGTVMLYFCLDIRETTMTKGKISLARTQENELKTASEEGSDTFSANEDFHKSDMIRETTESILTKSLTQVFAVIFWFMLLGPFGAVIYYFIAAMCDRCAKSDFHFQDSFGIVNYLKDILDWIPVRLITFTYALISHFGPVISIWLERLGLGVTENQRLLIDSGLTALHLDLDPMKAQPTENQQAITLTTRTLWTWIIVITVLKVSGWLL